ncbi:hypothetical protein HIM_00620 [Hirsutella minnesotensis 3608]|nr:hypothetical protein HIM_00620 [Hirsutella minnesotensis 3608]
MPAVDGARRPSLVSLASTSSSAPFVASSSSSRTVSPQGTTIRESFKGHGRRDEAATSWQQQQRQEAFGTPSLGLLAARQDGIPVTARATSASTVVIPATYGALHDSPPPGVVVAIVLGSVAGFLLLLLLVYAALGFGPGGVSARKLNGSPASSPSSIVVVENGVTGAGGAAASRSVFSLHSRSRVATAAAAEHGHHHRHHHHHHHHDGDRRRRRRRRSSGAHVHAAETVQVRTHERVFVQEPPGAPAPPVTPPGAAPPPTPQPHPHPHRPPPAAARPRPSRDRVDVDEVVVIEEHSPPPPPSRKKSRRHSDHRPNGEYRPVDPDRFAGGDAPVRHVRRERGRRYSSDYDNGY